MASYHYNHDGIVGQCSAATEASCPYAANGHFAKPEQAQQAFEQSMENLTHAPGATSTTKELRILRDKVQSLGAQARSCSPDEDEKRVAIYQQIGEEVMATVEKTQGVSLHHTEPITSQEELQHISTAFHTVLRELDNHRKPDEILFDGPQHKHAKEAISVLPSEMIKARNRKGSIYAKTLHGNTVTRDGVYHFQEKIGTYPSTPDAPESYMEPILEKLDLQHNEVTSGYIDVSNIDEVAAGRSASLGYRYNEKTDAHEVVFIGKPKGRDKGVRYKKVADSATFQSLYGERVELDAPIYTRTTQQYQKLETIASRSAKNFESEAQHHSVLLHEYTHSFQPTFDGQGSEDESGEMHLFHSMKQGDGRKATRYDAEVYDGFPDEYMGNVSGRELLPCSVQGVLRPGIQYNSQKLFEVHENATIEQNRRKIVSWVTGYLASWATRGTT